MIHLVGVTQKLIDPLHGTQVLLRDVNLTLPGRSLISILGGDLGGLSALLYMIAGVVPPDRGRRVAAAGRVSPVINASGKPGSTLLPKLTGRENIRHQARLSHFDERRLSSLVESACHMGAWLDRPVSTYDGPKKRAFEVALIAATPYDFYMVDRLHTLSPEERERLCHMATARGAALVFTTTVPQLASQYGRLRVEWHDGGLHFEDRHAAEDRHHGAETTR